MREFIAITKALADQTRVRLLLALDAGELCVCQLIELVALAPSTVSKHMAILRQAGLVEARKDGRWVNYRPVGDDGSESARRAIAWVREAVKASPEVRTDQKRLREILKVDPDVLCRRQVLR